MDVSPNLPSPGAYLLVQDGPDQGSRLPLTNPLTILGRGTACDLRVDGDGVTDLHCAFVQSPAGLVVRTLGAEVLVNGANVPSSPLAEGDLVTLGVVSFRVEVTERVGEDEERSALRIQAAAVVAQQAALGEEEQRLHQRQQALENQEQQLAAHLEERRQKLVEAYDQFRAEKAAWREQSAAASREQVEAEQRLKETRAEADQELALARDRRQRVSQLRRHLIQRFRKDWAAKEEELARREKDLEAGKARLAREAAGLQKQRAALHEARLRHNGTVELGRRQMQEQWEELGLAQDRWEHCLEQEEQAQKQRLAEAEARAAAADAVFHAREAEIESASRLRNALLEECAGLDARIRNTRQQLQDLERARGGQERAGAWTTSPERTPLILAQPPTRPPEPSPHIDGILGQLTRMSGQLADQRAHLVEQWDHLLACHNAFHQERSDALAEAEDLAQRLVDREANLIPREQALDAERRSLSERQEALVRQRHAFEAWQSRLAARESETEASVSVLIQGIQAHEQATQVLLQRQKRLRQRLARFWRAEVEALRSARANSDEARRLYLTRLDEVQAQRVELADRERLLAGEAVALEQIRLELLGWPAAEKRLDQLRRRLKAVSDRAAADREQRARAARAETDRLDERVRTLERAEERLLARQQKRARQRSLWETRRAQATATEEQLRRELQRLEAQHEADEQRLASLRDEVERLANVLLAEADPALPPQPVPVIQAA